jgi:hypothetical protein
MAKVKKINRTQKYITPAEAQIIAREYGVDVSYPTIVKWMDMNDLGHQVGGYRGKRLINQNKFRRFLNGENQKAGRCVPHQPQKSEEEEDHRTDPNKEEINYETARTLL